MSTDSRDSMPPNSTKLIRNVAHFLRVRRGNTCCRSSVDHLGLITGDCAIASGFVTYLGPFGKEMREHVLQNTLIGGCQRLGVPYSQDMQLPLFLSSDSEMGEWKLQVVLSLLCGNFASCPFMMSLSCRVSRNDVSFISCE